MSITHRASRTPTRVIAATGCAGVEQVAPLSAGLLAARTGSSNYFVDVVFRGPS